jgi:CHAT domain-containing protein
MILGGGFNESGEYDKAIYHIQQAIDIFKNNKQDTSRWAYALQYIGVSYGRAKQYDKAIAHFTESIRLMEKIEDTKGISESSHNIGRALFEQNKYTQALPYFEKAQKAYPHSEYLNNIAQSYNMLKQYTKAHEYARQSLDFAGKNQSLCYLYIPRIYVTLGDIFTGEIKPLEALKAYNQAAQLFLNNTISEKNDPLSYFPVLSEKGVENAASCRPDLLKVLYKKITPLSILFKNTRDSQYLKLQLYHYRLCESLLRDMLTSFTEENSRYFWTENVKDIYENGIRTAVALKEYDTALTFAESSKAFNLLYEVQNNRAKHFGGVPDSLLAREKALKSTIAFWQKITSDPATDSGRIAQARNGLFQAKQDFEGFQKQLEQNYPKYHLLKSPPPPLSISEVQKTLADDMALVEYVAGDSALYIFTFTNQAFQFYEQAISPDFYQNIADLRRSTGDFKFIKNQPDSAQMSYLKSARVLYKTLLDAPLSYFNKKTRLRVITDGALGYIPFDVLLTEDTDTWRGGDMPCLLRKMAVSYAYSNRFLNSDIASIGADDFCGFGISYDKDNFFFSEQEKQNEKVTALQYTVSEVHNIKSLLGGTVWIENGATKANFNKNAPKNAIIHLAMHGFLDAQDPLNSGLIFSRESPADTTNYLTGYDLYAAQLRAKLAVLSACNTGDGPLRGHEGVMSLARSFAYAGCESLVMSLWSVPDKTTSDIMGKFYENLKAGQPKDIALQNAKLYHLIHAEPSRRIPNSWGAMVLIGDITPLSGKNSVFKGFLWVLVGGLLLVLCYFIFKFKLKN